MHFKTNTPVKVFIIIMVFVFSTLSACSPKSQSTDAKSDTKNVINHSTITPTQVPVKVTQPLETITPALDNKGTPNISSAPKPDTISVKYIGNSCFYITFPDGTRLVTDPYGTDGEYFFGTFPIMEADVITISHDHSDHVAGINQVLGNPKIIRADGINKTTKIGKVKITGYTSEHVAYLGENIIFVYQYGDYKIVAMGETDNIESKKAINAVKGADLILAYAGEYGDVKNADSFKKLIDLNIKVMIPQHYSNIPDRIFYGQPNINTILKEVPKGIAVTKEDEFIVSKDMKPQFVELEHWGK